MVKGQVNKTESLCGGVNKIESLNGATNKIKLTPAYSLEGETLVLPDIEDKFVFTIEDGIAYLNTELTNWKYDEKTGCFYYYD